MACVLLGRTNINPSVNPNTPCSQASSTFSSFYKEIDSAVETNVALLGTQLFACGEFDGS